MNSNKTLNTIKKGNMRLFFLIIVFFILLLDYSTAEEESINAKVRIHHVSPLNPCSMKVVISIIEIKLIQGEEPIMGYTPLTPDSIEVYIDNKRILDIKKEKFLESSQYLDIIFNIDISGSISRDYKPIISPAIKQFIEKKREQKDMFGICSFGIDVLPEKFTIAEDQVSFFTDDIELLDTALNKKIDSKRTKGTHLYKSIIDTTTIIADHQREGDVQKVVLVLSDGENYDPANPKQPAYKIEDSNKAAQSTGVAVFTLGLPYFDPDKPFLFHINLEKISDETRGLFAPVKDKKQLALILEKLDDLIKNQLVLNFILPRKFVDGKEHEVFIAANLKSGVMVLKSDKVVFQSGIDPCPCLDVIRDKLKYIIITGIIIGGIIVLFFLLLALRALFIMNSAKKIGR